jgi:hypothetical protein
MEISIVNTSHIPDEEIAKMICGIENIMPEFTKDWGVTASVSLNGTSDIKLYITTVEGKIKHKTIAFHSIKDGIPYGRVYAYRSFDLKTISRLVSHEVFEIMVNPMQDKYHDNLEMEVCDPVMNDCFLEPRSNVYISNWITPSWFTGETSYFDKMNLIKSQKTVTPGGYLREK